MLRKLSLFVIALATTFAQAQFSVETHAGDPIVDGQTVVFGDNTSPGAYLQFYVNNLSTTDEINVRVEFESAVNADGTEMEVCFGLCFTGVSLGESYPINDYVTIQPQSTQTSSGDHFYNFSDGNGNVVEYNFRFYQVDASFNEIGDDLSFTYRYDPTLGIDDLQAVNASIVSTTITNEIVLDTQENLAVTIYDINGRVVAQQNAVVGQNRISVANLRSQMYVVTLQNEAGASKAVKIIKR